MKQTTHHRAAMIATATQAATFAAFIAACYIPATPNGIIHAALIAFLANAIAAQALNLTDPTN